MRQSNQLSRNLAAILLATGVSTTAWAQTSPDTHPGTNRQDGNTNNKGQEEASNRAPTAKIESPDNGDSFKASGEIQINIVANDGDGWTSQATFFANDRVIGEQSLTFIRQPDDGEDQRYSLNWSAVPAGKYQLHAQVTDDEGKEGRSRPVVIHVREKNDNGGNNPTLAVVQVETIDGKAYETLLDEEVNPGSFRIWRAGDLTHPLEVYYHMRGAGINGTDYELLSGVTTIEEGETAAEIAILPLDDELVEGAEQVVLLLDDVTCIAISPPSPDCYQVGRKDAARLNIFDNDRGHNFPPKTGMITPFKHQRFQAPVNISLSGEGLDKDGWIGAFQFLVNEKVVHEGTIHFLVAPEPGQRQHFEYLWENVEPGTYEVALSGTDNDGASSTSRPVKVEVIGDQELPEVTVFAKDALASETTGNENTKPNTATFRFRRTGKTDEPLRVAYRLAGTAENGVDYEALEGFLIIEANQRWGTAVLHPIADDLEEGRETVILSLAQSDQAYTLGRKDSAKALITDSTPDRKGSKVLKDGSIHLRLPTIPGEGYLLEVSDNLRDWEVVDTGVSEEDALDIIENRPGLRKGQYFRIRKAPEDLAEE
jgi:hypothetical protein